MKKKLSSQLSAEGKEQQYRIIFESASDGMIISDAETGCVADANPAAIAMHGFTREEFIGLHLTAYIHPDSQRLFAEAASDNLSGGIFDVPAVHLRKDGSLFYVDVRRTTITFQDRPCLLSVVRDVSERINAELLLHQRVELHTREQSTLLKISQTLASTLELQPGLILEQLLEIIEYKHGAFFSLEGTTLVTLAIRGIPQLEGSAPVRVNLNTPEDLTTLYNRHHPIHIADMERGDPQTEFLRSILSDAGASLLEGMRSWLWVPLAVKGRLIGGIGMAHEKRDRFTSHQAGLALSVANQAAITILHTELYGNAQALAVLEERQRLARNLHDAVNQSLFSAGLIAEVLPRLWNRDQDLARQSLEDLRRLTRGAMAEMRSLLAELHPSTLTDTDLSDLLRLLGNAFTGRTNIPAKLTLAGRGLLPAEVQVVIYRICQEALNNIAKHGGAGTSLVEMDLQYEEAAIELSIRDDGQGFDPELIESGHYGLSMMRERAEIVGAQLSITSQPGQGTELRIHWTRAPQKETQ